MPDYSDIIRAAVSNGTVFSSAAKSQLGGMTSQLQTLAGSLDGDLQTRANAALAQFEGLRTHMANQASTFSRDMGIFAEMSRGKAQVDVMSFFGSQFGGAETITAEANTAIAQLTSSPEAAVANLEALAAQAQTMVQTEQSTIVSSLETIQIESIVQSINSALNTPMGSLMMEKMGGPPIQAILSSRAPEEFDINKTVDDFLDQYGNGIENAVQTANTVVSNFGGLS